MKTAQGRLINQARQHLEPGHCGIEIAKMPHAVSMASPGLQALILCGPGSSFPTFTANPDENPKALLPIANRPMVWYPIDFCYRTGITSNAAPCSHISYYAN